MRKFWQAEFPVGDPLRGPAYGERTDPATLTIGTVLAGVGAGASVLGALSGGGKSAPPPPVVAPPPVMPTPDDQAAKEARRRLYASQSIRQGRESTILSNPADSAADLLG